MPLPTHGDLLAARDRLAGHVVVTPLLESPLLNAAAGGRVLVKAESLQHTGSFKFRGAWNAIAAIVHGGGGKNGVVAYSSGNHGQAVAAAARHFDLPAVVAMPKDAPRIKHANARSLGAELVLYDRERESREDLAQRLAHERNAPIVPPYDHRDVIAGQGTCGLELAEQLQNRDIIPDAVLMSASGGGLAAGMALALAPVFPETRLYCVEPKNFDDHARSLAIGQRLRNRAASGSLCDALMASQPGEMTFAINARALSGGLTVTDKAIGAAMRFAFTALKLVVEPSGAAPLAALLSGQHDGRGKVTVIILSGGNADPALFCRILAPDQSQLR